jgi:hypothetical protein
VFPNQSFIFSKLYGDSSIGIDDAQDDMGWRDLVECVGEAAAQQSAARGTELPAFFANDDALSDELLRRINGMFPSLNKRDSYRLEERHDELVTRKKADNSMREMGYLGGGDRVTISFAAALAAGDVMPVSPPLVGDPMLGYLDRAARDRMFTVLKKADRQVLLFSSKAAVDVLDISPMLELEQSEDRKGSTIVTPE